MRSLLQMVWAYLVSLTRSDATVSPASGRASGQEVGPVVRRYLSAAGGRWGSGFSDSLTRLGTLEASMREVRRQLVHSRRVPGQLQAVAARTITRMDSFLADPSGTLLNALARFTSLPRSSLLERLSNEGTALLEAGRNLLAVDAECERLRRLWDTVEQQYGRQLPETLAALGLLRVPAELADVAALESAARLRGLLDESVITLGLARAAHVSQLERIAAQAVRLGLDLKHEESALEQQLRDYQAVLLQAARRSIAASGDTVENSAEKQLARMESGAAAELFLKRRGTPLAASHAIRQHVAKAERTLLGHAVELDRFRPRSMRRVPKRSR